jgi:TolA-binding protein
VADVNVRLDAADQQMRSLQGLAQENQRSIQQLDAQLARLTENYARATSRPIPVPMAPPRTPAVPDVPPPGEPDAPVVPEEESAAAGGTMEDEALTDSAPAPPQPGTPAPEGATIEEAEGAYHQGNYDVAVNQAAGFLHSNPGSALADKAYFIQGLSYLKMGRERSDSAMLQRAVEAFDRVVEDYPRSDYMANALYNQAVAYNDMGQASRTESILRRLATEYPDSSAGKKAQEQLQKLRNNTN